TGQTFLVTGAGKFTVELVSSNSSPIPHAPAIGEFAGGSGVVQSISKNPPYITVILESVHIGVASQATATEVPQQPQASAWISALQGEANVEPAAVPPTDDVDGAVEITPVNSFCETTFRFPLFQSETTPSHWLRVQSKTLTSDGCSHLFHLNISGLKKQPPIHSIATVTGSWAVDDRQILLSCGDNQIHIRPGLPTDVDFKGMQILKQSWRLRPAGRIISSQASEFTMVANVLIENVLRTVTVRFMVPSSEKAGPRWISFRSPGVGLFSSGRGFIEHVEYGVESRFVVTLESATNPILSSSVIPISSVTAGGEDWLQVWQTPPPSGFEAIAQAGVQPGATASSTSNAPSQSSTQAESVLSSISSITPSQSSSGVYNPHPEILLASPASTTGTLVPTASGWDVSPKAMEKRPASDDDIDQSPTKRSTRPATRASHAA
ncbi:unnamed protein product, partial [Tilletia controversa]